ncbi:MAG: hypothetical protein PHU27_06430 [Salinivirgaceae bacterium]|nr:hypothetical protein [Salinivirgaceae bacterium]MDD4747560.1 hypothetical protein [Salinivirgaceae bacterium]MDY0280918.1 hypothetical protein [Salinivirgaceae bacterium]
MKALIKNSGLLILLVGLFIVAYTSYTTVQSNTGLWVGGLLIIVGLLTYILTNRYVV